MKNLQPPEAGEINGLAGVIQDCWSYYGKAAAEEAEVRLSYELASERIDLLFASERLVPRFTRALAHLKTPTKQDPDLVIRVWDSLSGSHCDPPRPDIPPEERDVVPRFMSVDERFIYCWQAAQVLNMLDRESSEAFAWTPDVDALERHETAAPFRYILSWWGGVRRKPLIHAGAVGRDGQCVLFAGRGGSGKSTTSLTCVADGLGYLSDDYLMVDGSADEPIAHSLYNSAKLLPTRDGSVDRLLGTTLDVPPAGEKEIGFMWENRRETIVTSARAVAVVLPRVVGGRTELRQVSRAAALKAIVPSTFLQVPGSSKQDLPGVMRFLSRLPAYELLLGDDTDRISGLVDGLIDRHGE
ncbi:MAG TPA: hypothetical protein VE174_14760 [Actinomycetota bacterium]|nr:hypothetical protein [Actinomycetota bacterium]